LRSKAARWNWRLSWSRP